MLKASASACAMLVLLAAAARAADSYPYAGVYSALGAEWEKLYGMDKFTCLASLEVRQADGSYTAYHINTALLGKDFKVRFHPFEQGVCEYTAATRAERCKVTQSNWGESEYFIEHKGVVDGVERYNQVSLRDPSQVQDIALRKCPFTEDHIRPFLSDEWLHYSDDDIGWTLYRHLPFNPDQGPKIARALGIAP